MGESIDVAAQATSNGHSTNGHSANGQVALDERADVRRLLDTLVEHAARPIEEAQALPGELYTNAAMYELEMERIFNRDWVYICRAEQVANPGDWKSAKIGDEPIVIVRGQDMKIRALSRVCPHRFMDLLSRDNKDEQGNTCDHGHVDGFVCPYHAWSFDLEGSMAGAPLMNSSKLFQRERDTYRMEEFGAEVWNGFVFVSLDPNAEPLAPRLTELEELVARYDLENWVWVDEVDWPEAPINWKLAMDNGRECYHHLGAHKASVEPMWPAHLVDADTTKSRYWYAQRMFVSEEAATGVEDGHRIQPMVLPSIEGLGPWDRSHYLLAGVYPSMFFACGPDMLLIGQWVPTGPESHKFKIGMCVHKTMLDQPDIDKIIKESVEWLYAVQCEDSEMLTGISPDLRSRVAQRGGALCELERPVWQFQRYLADRLTGAEL